MEKLVVVELRWRGVCPHPETPTMFFWTVHQHPHIHNMHNEESRDHFCSSAIPIKRKRPSRHDRQGSIKGSACWHVLLLRCSLGVKTEHEEASSLENMRRIIVCELTVEWKGPREEGLSVWERSRSWCWNWRMGRRNKENWKQMRSHCRCSRWRRWKWPHQQYLDTALNIVSWRWKRYRKCVNLFTLT